MEIHPSAFKHGLGVEEIRHALRNAITACPVDPAGDPPKELLIGPDRSGRLLELIWVTLPANIWMLIHAMPLAKTNRRLLPPTEGQGR